LSRVTIGHHQALGRGVYQVGVGTQVGLPLCEQGSGKHLAGGQSAQFVEVDRNKPVTRALLIVMG